MQVSKWGLNTKKNSEGKQHRRRFGFRKSNADVLYDYSTKHKLKNRFHNLRFVILSHVNFIVLFLVVDPTWVETEAVKENTPPAQVAEPAHEVEPVIDYAGELDETMNAINSSLKATKNSRDLLWSRRHPETKQSAESLANLVKSQDLQLRVAIHSDGLVQSVEKIITNCGKAIELLETIHPEDIARSKSYLKWLTQEKQLIGKQGFELVFKDEKIDRLSRAKEQNELNLKELQDFIEAVNKNY